MKSSHGPKAGAGLVLIEYADSERLGHSRMLSRVSIAAYRSCRNVEIDDIGEMLALVGRNGSGKTNILQAIAWAAQMGATSDSIQLIGKSQAANVTLEFQDAGSSYSYQVGIARGTGVAAAPPLEFSERLSVIASDGRWSDLMRRHGENVRLPDREPIRVGVISTALPTLVAILPADDDIRRKLDAPMSFLARIRYYTFEEPGNVTRGLGNDHISGKQYENWLRQFDATANPGDLVLMRILHLARSRPDDFEVLRSLMGHEGLGLIEDIRIFSIDFKAPRDAGNPAPSPESLKDRIFTFRFRSISGEHELDYQELSLGTRRVLRILVSMLFDRSSVMLIEQPEDGLHPGLTKKLVATLRANALPSQVVFASHSAALLNTLSPNEVRLITMAEGTTSIRALSELEMKTASQYMSTEGSLSEFLEMVQQGEDLEG